MPNTRCYRYSTIVARIGKKYTCFTMGIGANKSDFKKLKKLSDVADSNGGNGEFNHAGLLAAKLGDGFSKIASSMSTVRSGLLSKSEDDVQRDDFKPIVPLKERQNFHKSVSDGGAWKTTEYVSRFMMNKKKNKSDQSDDWYNISMINKKAVGFAVDKIAFAKGAERLAY